MTSGQHPVRLADGKDSGRGSRPATAFAPTTSLRPTNAMFVTPGMRPLHSGSLGSSPRLLAQKYRCLGEQWIVHRKSARARVRQWHGYDKTRRCEVAIKGININKSAAPKNPHVDNIDREVIIMKQLVHPNIIRLLDLHYTNNHVYLIMEYATNGDLSQLMAESTRRTARTADHEGRAAGCIHEPVIRELTRQLASGLAFLRSHKIIHRDLKPQNLLISRVASAAASSPTSPMSSPRPCPGPCRLSRGLSRLPTLVWHATSLRTPWRQRCVDLPCTWRQRCCGAAHTMAPRSTCGRSASSCTNWQPARRRGAHATRSSCSTKSTSLCTSGRRRQFSRHYSSRSWTVYCSAIRGVDWTSMPF